MKTKLQKVFALFTAKENKELVFQNPFTVNGKTYATNRHALVFCDSSKIDFKFENNEKPPNIEAVIPKENTKEIVYVDKVDWDAIKTADILSYISGECECCSGTGELDGDLEHNGRTYYYEYECPVCDGTGTDQQAKSEPTGEKTFPEDLIINFHTADFNPIYFEKLKKVKDIMGQEIELLHYEFPFHALLFQCGFIKIVLMPMRLLTITHEGETICIESKKI